MNFPAPTTTFTLPLEDVQVIMKGLERLSIGEGMRTYQRMQAIIQNGMQQLQQSLQDATPADMDLNVGNVVLTRPSAGN